MPTRLQFRRGNTAQTAVFTGAVAEITVNTQENTIIVHDGVKSGGYPAATYDFAKAAFDVANSAFTGESSAGIYANAAFVQANAAFTAANNAVDLWVRNQANLAYNTANSSFIKANASFDSQKIGRAHV